MATCALGHMIHIAGTNEAKSTKQAKEGVVIDNPRHSAQTSQKQGGCNIIYIYISCSDNETSYLCFVAEYVLLLIDFAILCPF